MKFVFTKSTRLIGLLFLVMATAALSAQAQSVRLQLDNLKPLESKAASSVDVSLDGAMLRFVISLLNVKDPKQAQIKDAISGIKGVYVKAFQFDKEGAYEMSDVDSVRAQIRAPGWSKMVGVKSNREGENVEVYMMMTGSQIDGIAVIAADPKSLAVVNMVGTIDLEKLVQLSGKFGIPNIDIHIGKDKE
jgi:hypothetical protein